MEVEKRFEILNSLRLWPRFLLMIILLELCLSVPQSGKDTYKVIKSNLAFWLKHRHIYPEIPNYFSMTDI